MTKWELIVLSSFGTIIAIGLIIMAEIAYLVLADSRNPNKVLAALAREWFTMETQRLAALNTPGLRAKLKKRLPRDVWRQLERSLDSAPNPADVAPSSQLEEDRSVAEGVAAWISPRVHDRFLSEYPVTRKLAEDHLRAQVHDFFAENASPSNPPGALLDKYEALTARRVRGWSVRRSITPTVRMVLGGGTRYLDGIGRGVSLALIAVLLFAFIFPRPMADLLGIAAYSAIVGAVVGTIWVLGSFLFAIFKRSRRLALGLLIFALAVWAVMVLGRVYLWPPVLA